MRPTFPAINRPLTIGGADRGLFFLALSAGGATFTFFGSLPGGLLMFAALFAAARWTTRRDQKLLPIVLRSSRAKRRYDPGKT